MERIKSLIPLKVLAFTVPTVLSICNGDTVTNLYDFANTFNNYFDSDSTVFLQPSNKEEIDNNISSLNSNKTSDPNSILL